MTRNGGPPLLAALVCFVVFFTNVAMGAAGMGIFLGDVAEMLVLFAASIFFVIGVLAREAATRSPKNPDGQSREETS